MLSAALREAALTPRLLVATDFDGTLAPLQDDPATVQPHPTAVSALTTLCHLPETQVCIISGRSLTDLWARMPAIPGLLLRGSYGAEVHSPAPPGTARATVDELHDRLHRALDGTLARLERKTLGVAVHTRGIPRKDAELSFAAAREAVRGIRGLREVPGFDILDFTVSTYDKGIAITEEADFFAPTTVVVLGDDPEDEKMFACAKPRAVTIKVGVTPTRAEFRVKTPQDAALALSALAEGRTLWATEHA